MKPLSNMQLAMDIVIVSIGLTTALWIFSKAVLNLVIAANKWVGVSEQSDNQTSQVTQRQEYHDNRLGRIL